MTVEEFDNGYWYATDVKAFAKDIGVQLVSKLRKDELEAIIKHFLRTGKIQRSQRKNFSNPEFKDVAKGLSLKLPIVNYTNDKETKDFLEREAKKIDPTMKRKSGSRYRLNRWREEQIENGKKITYGDLVKQYVKLNQVQGSFPQAPTGRYINFLSDYLAKEKGVGREEAIAAWKELKKLSIPKDYKSWKKYQRK
jgi:hypothetical protein